ncbi:MAG: Ig-like domain-containing protein [Myxococcota bacterium]
MFYNNFSRLLTLSLGTALVFIIIGCTPSSTDTPKKSASKKNKKQTVVDPFSGYKLKRTELEKFALHSGPKPPDKDYEKLSVFPVPPKPDTVKPKPLKIKRVHPKGKVKNIAAYTISFNQPMIPLASIKEEREIDVPVTIDPPVKGRFRWLGSSVLSFEAKYRFPFANHFIVKIDPSLKSASGQKLDSLKQFMFETPRAKVVRNYPSKGNKHVIPEKMGIFLKFNQKINPGHILKKTKLENKNGKRVKLQLVPENKWKTLKNYRNHFADKHKDRIVVLTPSKNLKKATRYTLTLEEGVRSKEGPLLSKNKFTTYFQTYGPMQVEGAGCGYMYGPCRPFSSPRIGFSNNIATDEEELVKYIKIRPRVKGLKIKSYGSSIYLRGSFNPSTNYKVRIRSGITDQYNQKLRRSVNEKIIILDAYPSIILPARKFGVLERKEGAYLKFKAINLMKKAEITLTKIKIEEVHRIIKIFQSSSWRYKSRKDLNFKGKIKKYKKRINTRKNKIQDSYLNLDKILKGEGGIVVVKIYNKDLQYRRWRSPYRYMLVQVTDLGLTAKYDVDKIVVMANRIKNTKALKNLDLSLYKRTKKNKTKEIWKGKTDNSGMALAPGFRKMKKHGPYIIWARSRKDSAFLVISNRGHDNSYISSYSWYARKIPEYNKLLSHVFTERNPYRPGEKVNLTGILRVKNMLPESQKQMPLKGKNLKVKYTIKDRRGNKVDKGEVKIDRDGIFNLSYQSDYKSSTGRYTFKGEVLGAKNVQNTKIHGSFKILAYRAPEHLVEVKAKTTDLFYGDQFKAEIKGKYTFGAPMNDADVSWNIARNSTNYQPPENPGYTFGFNVHHYYDDQGKYVRIPYNTTVASGKDKLDKEGKLKINSLIKAPSYVNKLPIPSSYTLEASVFDVNRQSITNRTTKIFHAYDRYLGLKLDKTIHKVNKPIKINYVVTDIKGKKEGGYPVTITAYQSDYKRIKYKSGKHWSFKYVRKYKKIKSCGGTSSNQPQACNLILKKGGYYQLRAETKDSKGRKVQTRTHIYVIGKGYNPPQKNQKQITLVKDKKKYKPGDTARVLINSPLKKATGLLTVELNGIKEYRKIKVRNGSYLAKIKITEKMIPNVYVSVALIKGRTREKKTKYDEDPGRPIFATGRADLSVNNESKKIELDIKPSQKVTAPGSKIKIKLESKDYRNKPVSSRIVLMMVDEGVLSLLGFNTPDPLSVFYHFNSYNSSLRDLRAHLLKKIKKSELQKQIASKSRRHSRRKRTSKEERSSGFGSANLSSISAGKAKPSLAKAKSNSQAKLDSVKTSASSGAGKKAGKKVRVRKKFATTAFFTHELETNNQGKAEVAVQLPDNLTTFRIMAVAAEKNHGDKYGKGDSSVTIRQQFMLRTALPRFTNYGDIFQAAVVLNNISDNRGKATITIGGSGYTLLDQKTKEITLGDKAKEVSFKVKTTTPGSARFKFTAHMGEFSDSVLSKPIKTYIPVSSEGTATYGVTESAIAQPVSPPKDVLHKFGGLNIQMSSSALTNLQDAVKYLVEYPYGSIEHLASRIFPIISLGEILDEFKLGKIETRAKRKEIVNRTINKILSSQKWRGGFPYWPDHYRPSPWVSAYVTLVLHKAYKKGYTVPESNLKKSIGYLNYIMRYYSSNWDYYKVFAGYVLSDMLSDKKWTSSGIPSKKIGSVLRSIYKRRKKLPLFMKAWMMQSFHRLDSQKNADIIEELYRQIDNSAVESNGSVHFSEGVTEKLRLIMHSNSRTDAIVLNSIIEVNPKSSLIVKIVRGLMKARIKGRWESTQANVFALNALSAYFEKFEKSIPDYTANVWYGDGFMGSKKYKGRSMKTALKLIPMKHLQKEGKQNLILAKQGKGKLFYRLGLNYVPTSLTLKPEERGFVVSRTYEAINDEKDVIRKKDHWQIKAGAYVKVKLRVIASDRRYYVAVDDSFPAGFEAVDAQLKTSSRSIVSKNKSNSASTSRYWNHYWFRKPNYHEFRDDKYIQFWDKLPAGVYEQSYIVRATIPGEYVVPPFKAFEMYSPEIFGRSGTDFVKIR